MAYKPNKWGYEGWKCKWKPSGSGTTHANRRAQRKHLQWEELEVKEPDTEEAVEDHVNALEKAAKKARERLEELKAKSLENDQKTEEEYSYYSYSPSPQPTGKRKLSKKSTKSSSASSSSSLGKDTSKTSLEKDAGRHLWKRVLTRHLWKRMLTRHLWKRVLTRHLWKRVSQRKK